MYPAIVDQNTPFFIDGLMNKLSCCKIVKNINNIAIVPIIILTPSSDIKENVIEPTIIPNMEGGIINLIF